MQTITNQDVANSTQKAEDEIDLLELAGILIAKWPVLLLFILLGGGIGFFVANFLRPSYSSDALLQVDQNGKTAGLAMGEMGALLDVASPSDAEIELIKSRRVLDEVVELEHLAYSAKPVAFLPRLLHTEGRVDVEFLHIPEIARTEKWMLMASADSALSNSEFSIIDPMEKVILQGKVGDTYRIPVMGDTFAIRISQMNALPEEKFELTELDPRTALDILKKQLVVSEMGKKTGIIQMQIAHRYPDRAASILNSIADT